MNDEEFKSCIVSELKFKRVFFKTRTQILLPFGPHDYIWYLNSGIILSERLTSDGALLGTGIYGPGMLLGVTGLNGESDVINCKTVSDTELYRFRTDDMMQLFGDFPEIMLYVLRLVGRRFKFALDLVENSTIHTVNERVEFFENRLREIAGDEPVDISDGLVAEFLGIHPVSVSRARKHNLKKTSRPAKSS